MGKKKSVFTKTPYRIVILRILLTPLFFFVYLFRQTEIAIAFFAAILLSDILDGFVARRQNILPESRLEAFLDPMADFIFVFASFLAFSLRLIYSFWVLVLLVFMFLFFLISSRTEEPVYDPIGKYYGIFLFGAIGVTLLFPLDIIFGLVTIFVALYTAVLFVCRAGFLWKKRLENEDLNP